MTPEHSKADTLARRILLHSRKLITRTAPFLLESIYALGDQPTENGNPISTDGKTLLYDSLRIISDFRKDHNSIARQLLHVTTHCLLGHLPQRSTFSNTDIFDMTADLKAAQFAALACGEDPALRPLNLKYTEGYDLLPSLPQLYGAVSTAKSTVAKRYWKLAAAARYDSHDQWDPPRDSVLSATDEALSSEGGPDWQTLMNDLLTGQCGTLPGSLRGFLQEQFTVEDRGLSYSSFLRRFATPEERLLTDPDSIDPRWYHLGLTYYGNVPLLEEAELSEPPVPDDLVIALDTSGSCSGDTCRQFLQETLGILRDISAGASRFRILLLQCDTDIRSEVFLESPQQIDELFRDFTAIGFGGTDFRPVFDRVAKLRSDGTLPRVRGLLYLSDGFGIFPDQPTDYPAAFLIPGEHRGYLPDDAEWITRLYFDQKNFTVKEAHTP